MRLLGIDRHQALAVFAGAVLAGLPVLTGSSRFSPTPR
jgi:hypothetical protein